jgi:hypothetical protein
MSVNVTSLWFYEPITCNQVSADFHSHFFNPGMKAGVNEV